MTRAREGQWLRDTPGHHPRKPRPKARGDEHDQQDVGDARKQVDAPGEDRVCPPAQGGGHPAEQGDDRAHQGGEYADADGQGQPGQGCGPACPAPSSRCPNRKERLGERFMREKSVSMARWVSRAPAIVTARSTARVRSRSRRALCRRFGLSHDLAAPLRILGVHRAVEEVGNQIAPKDDGGGDDGDAQEQGQVTAQPGGHCRLAQSGIGEHLLHQHRAADDLTHRGKLQGDGGKGHVPQPVAQDGCSGGIPPGPGRTARSPTPSRPPSSPGCGGRWRTPGDA